MSDIDIEVIFSDKMQKEGEGKMLELSIEADIYNINEENWETNIGTQNDVVILGNAQSSGLGTETQQVSQGPLQKN
jgi:hypothetical protein